MPRRLAGSALAYETAQQLSAAGHEVEFVALFDGGVPLPTDDDADNLAKRFAGFAAGPAVCRGSLRTGRSG